MNERRRSRDAQRAAESITDQVASGVDAWLRWLPSWVPTMHQGKPRVCRRCTGSPVLVVAGLAGRAPHQVAHVLNMRMQRIIDRTVTDYTDRVLPALRAELVADELWHGAVGAADVRSESDRAGDDQEAGEAAEQPMLFMLAESTEPDRSEPTLPRPPLTDEEKHRLRREIELADRHAQHVGEHVCVALSRHRARIVAALERFVEPQVRALLDQLAKHLEEPRG